MAITIAPIANTGIGWLETYPLKDRDDQHRADMAAIPKSQPNKNQTTKRSVDDISVDTIVNTTASTPHVISTQPRAFFIVSEPISISPH